MSDARDKEIFREIKENHARLYACPLQSSSTPAGDAGVSVLR